MRVSFDIGGLLSRAPQVFVPLVRALERSEDVEVYILTDMPTERAIALLAANDIQIPAERVHSANWGRDGERCKIVSRKQLGIDLHLDDHAAYAASTGANLGLLLMPCDLPYDSDDWKNSGNS